MHSPLNTHKTRRGDTIIEVMFGIAVFSLVAIMTINLMNNGLANAQANLESTMARNEMNAQAEALRFIHSSYTSTNGEAYRALWSAISGKANDEFTPTSGGSDCDAFMQNEGSSDNFPFVINTQSINSEGTSLIDSNGALSLADTYPIVQDNRAYGIWINALKGQEIDGVVYYYDFYISSCWYGAGSSTASTLDTVVRLYNPDRN